VRHLGGTISPAVELMRLLRLMATAAAFGVALLLWGQDADARLEGRANLDESGTELFMSAPLRETAPIMVALGPSGAGPASHPGGSLDGLFNRPGLLAGFAAGFLGSGLLGLMFGQGLVGGLSGVASFLGLIFQLALVVMFGRLIWSWWSGRNEPAFADMSPRQQAEGYLRSRNELLPGIYPPNGADEAEFREPTTSGEVKR